ncbi:hypothetical protein BLNAU_21965 [Blattamonas nauphoetae]|uniref:Uncharacterized protein n=1 Tax=Blattamonas nauphoetae TaxID=2049346 RepID=A0ABQ9WUX3_9EUKA|nr:hypothetical protein BLNAU_21965 [Blattamonas nauphoetae]
MRRRHEEIARKQEEEERLKKLKGKKKEVEERKRREEEERSAKKNADAETAKQLPRGRRGRLRPRDQREDRRSRNSHLGKIHHTTQRTSPLSAHSSDSVLLHRPNTVTCLLTESTPSPSDGWTARGGMSNTSRSHGRNDYDTKATSRRVRKEERGGGSERGERDERRRRHRLSI